MKPRSGLKLREIVEKSCMAFRSGEFDEGLRMHSEITYRALELKKIFVEEILLSKNTSLLICVTMEYHENAFEIHSAVCILLVKYENFENFAFKKQFKIP